MASDPILLEVPTAIEGPRLSLRAYEPGMGKHLFEAVTEDMDHLLPYMVWAPGHTSIEASEKVVRQAAARYALREDFTMGMWDRERERFLGGTGLHRMDWSVPSFEIGYWIRKSETGKGFVTEAVQLLTQTAFELLSAAKVHLRVAVGNEPSMKIPRKLGFTEEGVLRRSVRDANGTLRDMVHFGMLREEYEAVSWR